ncbi:MAG TPA: hypothetical protein PKX48_07760 [Planctomycetota bacterium]|jgi:DNA polymerase III delta prime subunit|nr:hypothetical protein [Planctomycetota bacterium]OQC21222.1 MAG: DNA polymerase III subunit tau [Planctomycetes bacterium ADurb.Bin069]HNR99101.1 hypothetical protein [Planctomycetota bacterium]HNU25862.1 hypothetical protein [Planctomycetota bacterium]HOE29758.1 hypothetical protein [Planctomycetota bacterium]
MNAAFVRDYFARALAADRLAHAYLLWGPAPEERDRVARDIALAFLCPEGPARGMAPCGACRPCRAVARGASPAFFELAANRAAIDIDAVRELIGALAIAHNGRRVVFAPRLERLTLPAAHAFLKTLEEPGGATLYLCTTGNLGALLPTIVSRCHRLPLYAAEAYPPPPENPDLERILADPARRDELDSDVLADYAPGEDRRERLRALCAHLAAHARRRTAALCGETPAAPTIFDALDLRGVLHMTERIVAAAADIDANIHPDLILECLLIRLRRGAA